MVGAIGFEPTTPCAQGRCATRLRYAPTKTAPILNYFENTPETVGDLAIIDGHGPSAKEEIPRSCT